MKQLRYVVSLAFVGAALTVVPAVQQAAAGDAPASAPAPTVREPALVQKVREGARGSVKVSTSRVTGKASLIRSGRNGDLYPSSNARPTVKADAFLATYARAFGAPRGQLVRTGVVKDRIGSTTLTYTQRYRGVPVFGAMLKVHVDKSRNLTGVNGALVPVKGLSLSRDTSKKAANARAIRVVRAEPPGVEGSKVSTKGLRAVGTHLVVYRHGLVKGVANGRTELAYQTTVTNRKNIRDVVFVSAIGGKVINRYSTIDDALSRILYEASLKPNQTIQFKKVWEEGKPTNKLNVDELNMVDSTGEAYWFFRNAFGRDSYDGAGHTMTTINNDPRIACPNANWNGITTNYCDGVSSDDVVAHEWGHAYTEYTSGLLYQWQPGAMNEAYSDIWGETVDLINGRQDGDEGDINTPREVGVCTNNQNANPQVVINSPADIAKICFAGDASFGPPVTAAGVTGDVLIGTDVAEPADPVTGDPAGTTSDGCSTITNDLTGKIALLDRGLCAFVLKAKNAQDAGAIGVVIANTLGRGSFGMAGDDPTVTIPTLGISNADGDRIRSGLVPGPVNVTMQDGSGTDKSDSYRWLVGEDSPAFGKAIRDMWSPTCIGMPGKVSDAEYRCDAEDNGGVHENSGVVNHSYALLVDGGTYNGVTVNGIGLDKAANIYFRAQNNYLTYSSGFPELADSLESSCLDLVGQPINELSTAVNDSSLSSELIDAADCAQVTNVVAAVQLRQDPTSQCGFGPLLQPGDPAICGDGFTPTTVYSEDFEDGIDGWTPDVTALGDTDFPWEASTSPVDGHAGGVAKGPDPDNHCTIDSTSANYLDSGDIVIPADGASPRMSFDNYIATEDGFDGGNVQLSVNGGEFAPIPAAAYTFNGPANLATTAQGNGNPLTGQPAFSGSDNGSVFGTWGVSQVDLTAAGVAPGDTVQLRLAMGRDACTGNDGWYVDNIEIVTCAETGTPSPSASVTPTVTASATATATSTATSTSTSTATPQAAKVATTTKVQKPGEAPAYKADFTVRVKVVSDDLTPTGKVVIKYQGVTIAKGKLVNGKVKLTIKKNLTVGKHKLVAKYKGSSSALTSKKVFHIKVVA